MFVNIDNPALYNILIKKLNNYFKEKAQFSLASRKGKVLDLPVSIDIETTSTETVVFPYIYMIGIDCICYATRYKQTFINVITELYNLSTYRKINVVAFIHNLNYELTFFANYFTDFEKFSVFATDKNKGLYIKLGYLTIIDTMRLAPMSLEKMAKNYKLKHKKLKGNLNYSTYRDCTTKLNFVEKEYCANDVIILNEYWQVYKKYALTKKNQFRFIYTSTSITRLEIKKHIKNQKKTQTICKYLNEYTPEHKELLNSAYTGAFVKSNHNLTNIVINDVEMYDYTSAYIGVLFEYKYPVTKFKPVKATIKDIENTDVNENAYVFSITLKDVKVKTGFSTISFHKLQAYENVILDNGRILTADSITLVLTEIDYKIISKFYTFKPAELHTVLHAKKDYLPKYLLDTAYTLFINKQLLKHDKNRDEVMYLLEKQKLNSTYGCTVEKEHIINYNYNIENGTYTESLNTKTSKTFLVRAWGTYITAYSRYNLLNTIYDIEIHHKNSVIYTDTDSIKVKDCDETIKEIIKAKNQMYHELIKKCCEHYNYNIDKLEDIGQWDYEGRATRFITNGSKKYAYEKDGKVNVTISGISKKVFVDYCTINSLDVFDVFINKHLIIPAKFTKKFACEYVNLEEPFQDENCNETLNFVKLKPVDFTFSIDDNYQLLLNDISETETITSDLL